MEMASWRRGREGRDPFARGRAIGIAVVAFGVGMVAVGCGAGGGLTKGGAGGGGGTAGGEGGSGADPTDSWHVVSAVINDQVDILLEIDNSASMASLQQKVLDGIPAFFNALEATALPAGGVGLPDVHIAVISSDTGPGSYDLPQYHCPYLGDDGIFQSAPRGTCTTPPLPGDQFFLAATQNQAVKNYLGDIASALGCIAALGDQGCAFEGQLKSLRLALDRESSYFPPENEGFLRDDANLAVILVTNEDDCSVPDDSTLFDPAQELVSDPLGPFASYRCNEFGHLCQRGGALGPPPRAAVENLTGCVSNDTATGRLTSVAAEVAFLKSLKADPSHILVAAMTGPAAPYSVEMLSRTTSHNVVEDQPSVVHSCIQAAQEYADPAVRIAEYVSAFGKNGLLLPICADSFAPAMDAIGRRISSFFETSCYTDVVPRDPLTDAPSCRVVERTRNAAGQRVDTLIPSCASNGVSAPCWTLDPNAVRCPQGGLLLTIDRGSTTPANDLTIAITCEPCPAGSHEIGCP